MILMKKTSILNIPNSLSFYRILVSPVILYFALSGQESLYAFFLVINLLSDVFDGYIARKYGMETEFGARLDSVADIFTYLLAFTGIYIFKLEDLLPHLTGFMIFAMLMASTQFLSLARFGRLPSFHLYSTKIGGYIQGAFFIVLFAYDLVVPLYYLMIGWGIMSAIEHITLQLILPAMRSNVRGLYWVLKEKRR
jgi:cardiolipin synthase (CMP-forming)